MRVIFEILYSGHLENSNFPEVLNSTARCECHNSSWSHHCWRLTNSRHISSVTFRFDVARFFFFWSSRATLLKNWFETTHNKNLSVILGVLAAQRSARCCTNWMLLGINELLWRKRPASIRRIFIIGTLKVKGKSIRGIYTLDKLFEIQKGPPKVRQTRMKVTQKI